MKILIDSGNSRLHIGKWEDENVQTPVSIPYPDKHQALQTVVQEYCDGTEVNAIAVCSVSPIWSTRLIKTLQYTYPEKVNVFNNPRDIGIPIRYRQPESMGIDRVLAGYAAWKRYREPCVSVGLGTAITIDAISGDGEMYGGYIVPGYMTMAKSLSSNTGLPFVSYSHNEGAPGLTTEACIHRGIAGIIHAGVERLVAQALDCSGGVRVITSGGDGEHPVKDDWFSVQAEYRQWLVLEGLGFILDQKLSHLKI